MCCRSKLQFTESVCFIVDIANFLFTSEVAWSEGRGYGKVITVVEVVL